MSFYDIWQELYDILVYLRDNTTRLHSVYNYHVPSNDAEGFPYAYVTPGPGDEKEMDTATNQALYNYTIRATDVGKDKASMDITIRQLADDILSELRKRGRQDLGGIADRLRFSTQFYWDTGNGTPVRYVEIEVEVLRNHSIDL